MEGGDYIPLAEATQAPKGRSRRQIILFYAALFLVFGTGSVVFGKVLYQTKAVGKHGDSHDFLKPWFQNAAMFAGMMLCLGVYNLDRVFKPEMVKNRVTDKKAYYVVMIPAVCDFSATFMMNVGLLWIPASVWQMIRGSIVIFSVLIRMVWLKKRINSFEWLGVSIIMVALGIVGFAAVKKGHAMDVPTWKTVTGIMLVFVAQLVQALQTVVEEHLLQDIKASSRLIVGLEGLWGFVLCAFIAMPLAQFLPGSDGNGIHEDTLDSFVMLSHSATLIVFVVIFVFVILGFNICGMRMTKYTNSVSRNVMEAVRTMVIWITGLFIYYVVSKDYGENWDSWSWIQLAGFLVLVFGLFIYYKVLKLTSLFDYPEEEEEEEEEAPMSPGTQAPPHWSMTPKLKPMQQDATAPDKI